MNKGSVSYMHKAGEYSHPAHAHLVSTYDHAPIWTTIKKDEHDKVCMSIGHVGEGAYVKLKVCNVSDIKAMLDDLHAMVKNFEEEAMAWTHANK